MRQVSTTELRAGEMFQFPPQSSYAGVIGQVVSNELYHDESLPWPVTLVKGFLPHLPSDDFMWAARADWTVQVLG